MAGLVVVSAPSGAGKTTVIAAALARKPEWLRSISATTRRPRPDEQDGIDYFFLTPEDFSLREASGEFLETAEVHGHRYGTPRAPVEEALREGKTMLLEIDIQGARSVRAAVPAAKLIFIEPPSWEVLRERLVGRATEDDAAVLQRLARAHVEMQAASEFDHRIVNDTLEDAVSQLVAIIESH